MKKSKISSKQKELPRFVFLLFSLASGIIGFFFIYSLLAAPLYGLWKTRSLVQVPAKITKWELETTLPGGKSPASAHVEAEYIYEFEGNTFSGTQVSLFKYDRQIYYDLLNRSETLCYINPNDPSYAVLDRSFNLARLIFNSAICTLLSGFFLATTLAFIKKGAVILQTPVKNPQKL